MDDLKERLARKMYEGVRGKREPDVSFDEQVEPCREAYFDGAQIAIDMLGADRIEALEKALEMIADLPDPGEEKERTSTFYRIHIGALKQIAAKAIGRQVVSDAALEWLKEWESSDEGKAELLRIAEARRGLAAREDW